MKQSGIDSIQARLDKGVLLLPAAVCATLYVWNVWRVWNFTLDDSYIFFRYAVNFAEGHGFRFNPGDAMPTEGITSFLWALMLGLTSAASLDVVPISKLLGVACSLGTAALIGLSVAQLSKDWRESGRGMDVTWPIACLAGTLFLALGPTAVHSVSGMETSLACVLVGAVSYGMLTLCRGEGRPHTSVLWGVSLLLLGMTRPELNLFCIACVVMVTACRSQRRKGLAGSTLAIVLCSYILPGALYFLWRWLYFGTFLPLPYYLKVSGAGLNGLGSVAAFVTWPVVAVSIGILAVGFGFRYAYALVLPALLVVLFFLKPAHLMGIEHRFLYPMIPCLLIALFGDLPRIAAAIWPRRTEPSERDSSRVNSMRILLERPVTKIAAVGCFLILLEFYGGRDMSGSIEYSRRLEESYGSLARFLQEQPVTEGRPVLALGSVGLVPFRTDWHTIDVFGLCNRKIALDKSRRREIVWDSAPDAVVVISGRENEVSVMKGGHWADDPDFYVDIYREALRKGYVVRKKWCCGSNDWLWLMMQPRGRGQTWLGAG
jgi:hypothetical protein